MSDQTFDADIAIIGYGPTGVSAANVLGQNGVKTIAFERAKDIYARARAVTINDWTMRCFQSVGLDAALKQGMDETYALRWVTYDGRELSNIRFPPGEMGHARSFAIYQPVMEETLRQGAARFAEHVDVRYAMDVTELRQDENGVTLTVTDTVSGKQSTSRVRYALACDGGSSKTRESLGIALMGDTIETRWIIIDAKVKRWWPNRHILTFWSDKNRPAVDIALSMGNHRWELPLQPQESESDFQTHDQLWRLLGTMGVTTDDVEIHQHAFYKHHIRHAQRWREKHVFLLGDAAHLMPPWAGNGMQSGVRDAFNLCWKLTEVLRRRLPESVLESYEIERAPDVERYTQISVGLGRLIKQELSDEELAAMRPPPDAPPALPPILRPPAIRDGWLTGEAGENSAVGKMIPQPRIATGDGRMVMLDKAIGNGFVLLGDNVDPKTFLSNDQRGQWDRLNARYIAIRAGDQRGESTDDIIDLDGGLLGWMRAYKARVIALRPDRFAVAADISGLSVPNGG